MLPAAQLAAVLPTLETHTLRSTYYRATAFRHLNTLSSTQGGFHSDNRYTPKRLSQAIYLAEGPDLAMLEASRQYQAVFQTPIVPGYVIFPVGIHLRKMLDLTDPDICWALQTSQMELTGPWRDLMALNQTVVTQELGREAFIQKFDAIRYPSAYASNRSNLVVFTEHLEHPLIFHGDQAVANWLDKTATLSMPVAATVPTGAGGNTV